MKTLLLNTSVLTYNSQILFIIFLTSVVLLFKNLNSSKTVLFNILIFLILLGISSRHQLELYLITSSTKLTLVTTIISLSFWILLINNTLQTSLTKTENLDCYFILINFSIILTFCIIDFLSILLIIEFVGIIIIGTLTITTSIHSTAHHALILVWVNAISAFLLLFGYLQRLQQPTFYINTDILLSNIFSEFFILFAVFIKIGLLPTGYWLIYFYKHLSSIQLYLYLAILYPTNLILFSKLLCCVQFTTAISLNLMTLNLFLAIPVFFLLLRDPSLASVLTASSCSTAIIILITLL